MALNSGVFNPTVEACSDNVPFRGLPSDASDGGEMSLTVTEFVGPCFTLLLGDLGDLRFVFRACAVVSEIAEEKYLMEVFWNPKDYGKVEFVVGMHTDDINSTMNDIRSDLTYYVNYIEACCRRYVEVDEDADGAYQAIICSHFCSCGDCDCDCGEGKDCDSDL